MGLLLCSPKSSNGYIIPDTDIKVYCLEELCYFMYNNTYMVSIDFFTKELVDFIEKDLTQISLAQKLKSGIDYNEGLTALTMHLMNSCNYYNDTEKSEFEKEISKIGVKSPAGRVKARADMLLSNKKYLSAIAAYQMILDKKDISQEEDYYSNIANNIGVAYVNMFEYEESIKYFEKAYELFQKEQYIDNIVCAAILNDDEEILNKVIKTYSVTNDMLDKYKKAIEYQTKQIIKGKNYREIVEKVTYDGDKTMETYNQNVTEVLKNFRDDYRRSFGN